MALTLVSLWLSLIVLGGFSMQAALHVKNQFGTTDSSVGAAFGLCLMVWLSFLATESHLSYRVATIGFFSLTLLASWALWRARSLYKILPRLTGHEIWILAAVALSRLALAADKDFPLGWDPVFHLLLSKKILVSQSLIHDWKPFRDITLNYPIGTHNFVVWFHAMTHVKLELVFNYLIPLLGILNTWQVSSLVRQTTKNQNWANFTAFSYGLLALIGSIDYYRWGGLPNQLGMTFVLAACSVLSQEKPGRGGLVMAGLLLGAVPLTHHHVMLTAGVIFGLWFLAQLRLRNWRACQALLAVALLAAGVSAPQLWDYASKVGTVGKTGITTFSEAFTDPLLIPDQLGYAFAGLALYGFWRQRKRGRDYPAWQPWGYVAAGLVALFVLLGYVVPWMTLWTMGRGISLFTPSRFLTASSYFLAPWAGYGLMDVYCRLPRRQVARWALAFALVFSNKDAWREQWRRVPIRSALREAYGWVADKAPESVLLCDQDAHWGPEGSWSSYLTGHVTGRAPVPISEPLAVDPTLEQAINGFCTGGTPSPLLIGHELWDVVPASESAGKPILALIQDEVAIIKK